MTLEYLEKQKKKYQNKSDYFAAISFDTLANDFQGVVDLIGEMEEYINENSSDQISKEEVYEN